MSGESINVTVAQSTIMELVKGTVNAQLVKALEENQGKVIESIVGECLFRKVDRNYKTKTVLDWAISDALEKEVKQCLEDWMNENRPKIFAAFKKKLGSAKTAEGLAESLVSSLTDGLRYSLIVNIQDSRK